MLKILPNFFIFLFFLFFKTKIILENIFFQNLNRMKIKSIQKTTLIDYPGKIACTLFLFGCSFRCGFCHNPELVTKEISKDISNEEIMEFLKKRKDQLEGVCFTGGEPLMTLDKDFLKEIKSLGYSIKIDTNGSFPDKLGNFLREGLIDFVSMDIKSSREDYSRVANVPVNLENIEKSVRLIIDNLDDYEFRTTVINKFHSKENIIDAAKWIFSLNQNKGRMIKKYVLQGFKNNGKMIDTSFSRYPNTPEYFLNEIKDSVKDYFENIEVRY